MPDENPQIENGTGPDNNAAASGGADSSPGVSHGEDGASLASGADTQPGDAGGAGEGVSAGQAASLAGEAVKAAVDAVKDKHEGVLTYCYDLVMAIFHHITSKMVVANPNNKDLHGEAASIKQKVEEIFAWLKQHNND